MICTIMHGSTNIKFKDKYLSVDEESFQKIQMFFTML